ncbi:MAG: hypothetical protein AB7L09_12700 [Nitrospira sp.]
MTLVALRPLHIRRSGGDLHLKPGLPVDLPDGDAVRLLAKKPDAVRLVLRPGDIVEWLSPALPKQHGEVLDVYEDGTFEVVHTLSVKLCRLPMVWVTRVVNRSIDQTGGSTVAVMRF